MFGKFDFGAASAKLAARLRNGVGFELTGAELKIPEISITIPDTPLFLQAVEGSLVFNPKWGFDLGVEATLGPVVADQKLIKFNGNIRGGASTTGCTSAPDPAEVTLQGDIPALKELGARSAKLEGTSCLSSTSLAMATNLKIEAAQAFTGCDLAPWEIAAPTAAGASAAAAGGRVPVSRGLPFVGFSAAAAKRPPRLRVLGPHGESFTAPANRKGSRSRDVVFALVPAEDRMYVFVRRQAAGRGRVVGLDGPIRAVRSARGLADPKITVKVQRVNGARAKRRLVFRIRPIPGQTVRFYDRADNVVKPIGRATSRRRGTTVFTPGTSADRSHTIEAVVTNGRFPRAILTVARFRVEG